MLFAKRYHPQIPSGKEPSEIARINFQSCSHTQGCPILSNDEWYGFGDTMLPFLRMAFLISEQDKPEVLEDFKRLDLEMRSDLIQNLELLSGWLNGNVRLVEAARARLAIACACLAENQR